MNRLEEINLKHDQLRTLLDDHQADALWIRRTRNIAWMTAGADASIPADSETGMYTLLITPTERTIYTDNIEVTRLRAEEDFEALGFKYVEYPWYSAQLPETPHLLIDNGGIEDQIQQLRWVLCEGEQTRVRALGHDTARAVEEAARAVRPGDTEYEIAARLLAAARKRGGFAVINVIAADERMAKFRHPIPTSKRLEKYAILVLGMRRGGLVVSAARLVHIGNIPADLTERLHKTLTIEATAMAASRPGRTLGDVFADIQAAYAVQGEADQWQLHHQGGLGGYAPRERLATPGDPTPIQVGQLLAWNPSIVSCKSEDTILLTPDGFDIISASPDWATVEITVGGQKIPRPGIIEL